MRHPPMSAHNYDWNRFDEYADQEGIGEDPEEFMSWWRIWKYAYVCGAVDARKQY